LDLFSTKTRINKAGYAAEIRQNFRKEKAPMEDMVKQAHCADLNRQKNQHKSDKASECETCFGVFHTSVALLPLLTNKVTDGSRRPQIGSGSDTRQFSNSTRNDRLQLGAHFC
jgi:hypothetical protein